MDIGANKTPVEVIKEGVFGGTSLETFILVLMVNGIESDGKNLMSSKILIRSIIVQIVMMLVLIIRVYFGKVKGGLIL